MFEHKSAADIADQLGERLKLARLNQNKTQIEVAQAAGVSRKIVMSAEKGKVQLENLIAIMQVLELTAQLEQFLPAPQLSPVQLLKLQNQQRQRASGRDQHRSPEPQDKEADW